MYQELPVLGGKSLSGHSVLGQHKEMRIMSTWKNSEEMELDELSTNLVQSQGNDEMNIYVSGSLFASFTFCSLWIGDSSPAPGFGRIIVSCIRFLVHCEERRGKERNWGKRN